jgi:uncharacterized membrane protein YbhN (UPF0104 family)
MTDPTPAPVLPVDPSSPEPRRRLPVLRIFGTLLSLGLLVYLVYSQGWNEFAAALSRVPLTLFFLALLLMFGSRLSVALRWYVLLRSAQVKLGFWQCLRLVFMGLFASNFLPTTVGGDLVRLAAAVALRVEAGVVTASLVVDRLIGMAGMSSLAPVGLAIVLRPGARDPGGMTAAVSLPFGWLALGLRAPGENHGSRFPGARWLVRKAKDFSQGVFRSAGYWLKRPRSLLLALLCTYGHMFFTFMVIYLLLKGMGYPLSFWWIAGLWSLSYFITLAPVSVNGLGVQELSISLLYSHFGGVPAEVGLALALFMRMIPLLASLPGALFLPDILRPLASRAQPRI